MTWTNRVVWQEGMFLRAQHFQQQDRWLEMLVRTRAASLRPYPWGLVEIAVDRDLLATGRFALMTASGIFEDGTPFAIPAEADHPPPLELPNGTRNAVVYLALPVRQAGAAEIAASDDTEGRYAVREFEASDTHSASPQPAPLQIGRLRLRYLLETDERAGYLCLGVARVEVAAGRRAVLDENWIPPALVCSAAPPLSGFVKEIAGALNQRGDALAVRSTAELRDLMWLQAINRWQQLLVHWGDAGDAHPEDLYSSFVQMAGEFATFTEQSKRPKSYAAYRHDNLQSSFAAVVADLRHSLTAASAAASEPAAVNIPLQERRFGVRLGQIVDRSVLSGARFVLIVQADMPAETLRRVFPGQVKIGAAEHIREIVNAASPGIAVNPLTVPPQQIPVHANACYFELDRNSPHWRQMQQAAGIALHVSGDFPNLRLDLWAIRG
ncbi:MAG TPA: type VI secretion system baseplate subunit TssK [Stellaceae bacterium]|nr:type VI secretion system baseplate subunit TssK [Stellaceae bacterium]